MAENTEVSGIVHIMIPVVIGVCNLHTPKKYEGKGEEKYGATFVMPPDHPDLKPIKDRIVALIKAKWPTLDIGAAIKGGNLMLPYQTGERAVAKYLANLAKKGKQPNDRLDWLKGQIVLKASSKYQPQLSVIQNGKVSAALEGAAITAFKGKFFTGAEALVELNLKAYDAINDGSKPGITAYLSTVVVTGKGTRRGGGVDPSIAFASYKGSVSNEDPTAGMDDEIPF
jgi:hypothetical protein